MKRYLDREWLMENTTLRDPQPGQRITLADVQDWEVSDKVDPETGALLMYPVGSTGRASKNARPVKLRNHLQSIRVVARTTDSLPAETE